MADFIGQDTILKTAIQSEDLNYIETSINTLEKLARSRKAESDQLFKQKAELENYKKKLQLRRVKVKL